MWKKVSFSVQKHYIPETGTIRPNILLKTNKKSDTHFLLVPKSTSLNDFEGLSYTPFHNTCAMLLLLIYIAVSHCE